MVMAFATALGEFGAVVTFAANVPGMTQTLPLAIYAMLQQPGGEAEAARLASLSFVLALLGLATVALLQRWAAHDRIAPGCLCAGGSLRAKLSGGEKSRVALARALASRPDFLLLDEPFAALDGARRRAFIRVLVDMHRSWCLPMLIVTHNIDDAAMLGSHLVALKDGRVVAAGEFAEASRKPEFQALLDSRDKGAIVRLPHSRRGGHWLRADHVLLAMEEPRAISARNVLIGTVQGVVPEPGDGVLVELATEAGTIVSRLTPEAVDELGLSPRKKAWAVVKAHAL
jgi:molybdopterin-binding protein